MTATGMLTASSASSYLAGRGFAPQTIARVGWRVEQLGPDASRYGLPRGVWVWVIPYRACAEREGFERDRLVDPVDLKRVGGGRYRQPAGESLALYDPFGVLESAQPPGDCVLVVEGEANAVACWQMAPDLVPVVGLPGQNALKLELAAQLADFPVVFVWIDRHEPGAQRNAQQIAKRLGEHGVEVRQLDGDGRDANELLQQRPAGEHRGLLARMLDQATPVSFGCDGDGVALSGRKDRRARSSLTAASEIRCERVRWGWKGRIPLRGLTVFAGEKGLGKSALTNARLVADVTRGRLDGELRGVPADVILVTAEDDWRSVVVPRLKALGADLDRVHRWNLRDEAGAPVLPTFPDDVELLEREIADLRAAGRSVAGFVIDPAGWDELCPRVPGGVESARGIVLGALDGRAQDAQTFSISRYAEPT